MSCGTKIEGRTHSYWEREELAEKLERGGEDRIARAIRHGDCLNGLDLRRAESALDSQGLSRRFDYAEDPCRCSIEDEEE